MKEIWKGIPGYENEYQVSNKGNVKSLGRAVNFMSRTRHTKDRILKQSATKTQPYPLVVLQKNGVRKAFKVHQLMAMVFLGHKPNGHTIVVDHINNIKTDNRIENLQLVTARKNSSKDTVSTSKYTGVSWCKATNRWKAQIQHKKQVIYLGVYSSEYDAYAAYKNKLNQIQNGKNK
jgi:hypothetical protein